MTGPQARGDPVREALELLRAGNAAQAEQRCRTALERTPGDFNALQLLGAIALQRGDYPAAVQWLQRAIGIRPTVAAVRSNLAVALLALGRPAEALDSSACALALEPRYPEALLNRGNALLRLGRPAEAVVAFDRALALRPDWPELLNDRGAALRSLGRLQEAVDCYERALRLRPDFAAGFCNLANVALDTGRAEDALRLCDRALVLQPQMLEALNIRGTALRMLRRYEEATRNYAQLFELAPDFGHAASHLLFVRASICDWRDRDALADTVIRRVRAGGSASTPHVFLAVTDSAADQLRCARTFVADHFPPLPPLCIRRAYAHPRLRIAYLSADFNDHPVAHLIAGVLERHDRSRFETVGVSLRTAAEPDAMQRRLRDAFGHFLDATSLSDADMARQLRAMEIDIAVDLTAHTRDGRLGILAHRPAPIQVQYLGYAGSSGADFIDYTLADRITVPPGDERYFNEQVVRLPYTFLPNDDMQPIATDTPARRDLGLPAAGFVFCALHNPYKINPPLFDAWMRILHATPGSVLWLRDGEPALVANLRREAAARGINAERLVFAGRVPGMAEHLARYRQADLFLDTAPYGGHATARDALWAGLPVLTCSGGGLASRVAASLLHALGLPELVTASLVDYERLAVQLARDPARLAGLRARVATQRRSPAFATDLYRAHLEAAYIAMWDRLRQGLAPAGIDLPIR